MLIQTETTPNPAALKFLPGQKVMESGTRDFATPEDAEASPLAEAIFSTGEVEGVFFGRDFISVTAAPGDPEPQARSTSARRRQAAPPRCGCAQSMSSRSPTSRPILSRGGLPRPFRCDVLRPQSRGRRPPPAVGESLC